MSYQLECPQCRQPLDVPPEYVGTLVRCPACSSTFLTALPKSPPTSTEYLVEELAPGVVAAAAPAAADVPISSEHARGIVAAPALCLLVVAMLGFFADVIQVVQSLGRPINAVQGMPPWFDQMQRKARSPEAIVFVSASAVLCLVIAFAAFQMMRLRYWSLALAGSMLAIINCANLCCLLGLPVGIWSIMTLLRPDVRDGFVQAAGRG